MTPVEETVATFEPPECFYRIVYETQPNVEVEYPISSSLALDLDGTIETAQRVASPYRVRTRVAKVTTTDD